MINWDQTTLKFGYQTQQDFVGVKRPKVICSCDECSKQQAIAIRVKSRVIDNQMYWRCPHCVGKRPEERNARSKQMLAQHQNQEYKQALKAASLATWQKEGHRKKHSAAVSIAMKNANLGPMLRARYANPEARELLRKKTLALFADKTFKQKHLDSMHTEEVHNKISISSKKRWESVEYREKMMKVRLQQRLNPSKIQKQLYQYLTDLNIAHFEEGEQTAIGYYVFDCLIPRETGQHILVECQGEYWHDNDVIRQKDRSKFTYIERYFPDYKIVYFWEREFYQQNKVINKLKALLGVDQNIVDFSFKDVNVRPTDGSKDFLELYHYLGPGRNGNRIGAYLNDELIAVAVFSPPQRQNLTAKFGTDKLLECSRFCIHPSYQKRNFASWFIAQCTKRYKNLLLISYADTTAGHTGTIYKAAGWDLHHEVPPDYWYADVDGFVMHKKTLYNRAVSLKMTEPEFATKYGYFKIFGGKKLCFVKQV